MRPPAGVRIATRGSALALRQAELVRAGLEAQGQPATLVVVETQGDRNLAPLRQLQGQGFFTKAVQEAVLQGRADLAVHSYKDLPTAPVAGLAVVAVSARADPRDTLLLRPEHRDAGGGQLPLRRGARVGTGSVRRRQQLLARRADLEVADLRGNVPTRIGRLRAGDYDAIVVAAAGLERLDLDLADLEAVDLDPHTFVPAPAQGALALEAAAENRPLAELLRPLHHPDAHRAVSAERRLMAMFEGGCQLALGAYATVADGRISMHAWYQGETVVVRHPAPEGVARLAYEALGRPDPAVPEGRP